ncbi:subfamily M23B non-peptidaseue (M23 family) [Echinococcus granulosus]|uniref:Subfamily M23B non-peptidaseue (M23 family) n=1 Tax=Echinococcus granulosus TaxID=6210 RepID=W6UL96_ECHGR|nr:subfamily M23B non-peptidaseue (M23 family) [Echinococcus granulosus]EUB61843.1 subfamily M23B non-peptidaseue (M23 family) [Echinococcus granulosus]
MDVTWKHNGVVLEVDNTDVVLFYIPERGLCELTISEAFVEDAGVYEIEALNEFGVAVSQTEVVVRALEELEEPVTKEIPLKEATFVEEELHPEEVPIPIKEVVEETSPLVKAKPFETELKLSTEAKPMQEELVEKDKLYEFTIGAKGKSKGKTEIKEEKEVTEEERREGAPGPVEMGKDKVDGKRKKESQPEPTVTAVEKEEMKESRTDLEVADRVDGKGALEATPLRESVPKVPKESEEIEFPRKEFSEDVQALPESAMETTSNGFRCRYKFA